MTACVHGNVCREYLRQHKGIICQTCPSGCRFYEPKRERTCRICLTNIIDTLGQRMFQCSSCGYLMENNACFSDDGVEVEWISYCPNCGAKVIQE